MTHNWDEATLNNFVIPSQREMIQRVYPEYDGSQYVLWLVFDYFNKYEVLDYDAIVTVHHRDGGIVTLPKDAIVRKPYPNKWIAQIGLKCGRKRCFGIPLMFSDFRNLSSVDHVTVQWNVYARKFLDNRAFQMLLSQLLIDYTVNFEDTGRIFTLASKDVECTLENCKGGTHTYDKLKSYDTVVWWNGHMVDNSFGNDRWAEIDVQTYEVCVFAGLETDEIWEKLDALEFPKACVAEMIERSSVLVKDEVRCDRYYYQKDVTLSGADYADILPEPCFGFKKP